MPAVPNRTPAAQKGPWLRCLVYRVASQHSFCLRSLCHNLCFHPLRIEARPFSLLWLWPQCCCRLVQFVCLLHGPTRHRFDLAFFAVRIFKLLLQFWPNSASRCPLAQKLEEDPSSGQSFPSFQVAMQVKDMPDLSAWEVWSCTQSTDRLFVQMYQ